MRNKLARFVRYEEIKAYSHCFDESGPTDDQILLLDCMINYDLIPEVDVAFLKELEKILLAKPEDDLEVKRTYVATELQAEKLATIWETLFNLRAGDSKP